MAGHQLEGSGFGGASIAATEAALRAGATTASELAFLFVDRIAALDRAGPCLRAVLELEPEFEEQAAALDEELRLQGPRGVLHGLPVLIKDNIDVAGAMLTSAGSLALTSSRPGRDATVVSRLRRAGALVIGKTNLSEWANFRSTHSSSGWSGRGGQTRNPYVLDRSPCGSSSGSAVAVAAGLAAAALGTETDGSVVCPSSVCGVVGIKPTVGLTSRAGVIPISTSQDTVGVHARSVADAAAMLSAIAGFDPADPATADTAVEIDFTRYLDSHALKGARIGVARAAFFGYSEPADRIVEAALVALREAGAEVIDPADLPTAAQLQDLEAELTVLRFEFHAAIDAYLAARADPEIPDLAALVEFNRRHADREMPYFGQEHFEAALETGPLGEQQYRQARAECLRLAGAEGIDAALTRHRLDALVAPTTGPAWTVDHVNGDHHLGSSSGPAAMAGYPLITVPAGFAFDHLPVGLTFMGGRFQEAKLIALAHAFEVATAAWRPPAFLPSLPPLGSEDAGRADSGR